jgi:hypothetical protein
MLIKPNSPFDFPYTICYASSLPYYTNDNTPYDGKLSEYDFYGIDDILVHKFIERPPLVTNIELSYLISLYTFWKG